MEQSSSGKGHSPARPESSGSDPRAPEPVEDLDWRPDRARILGEKALDLWVEFLERLPSLPVARNLKVQQIREAVTTPVPEEPMADDALMEHIRKVMFGYSTYPGHPAFFGYITGSGTVPGAVADLLASSLNANLGAWLLSPAASEIELHLTRWFAQQFGFPETGGGVFVSGGAMANLVGLKLARDFGGGGSDVRTTGLWQAPQMMIYASAEVHTSVFRDADILGMGQGSIRAIPTDADDRIRIDLLVQAIEEDLARGLRPVGVIGSAGTVETGVIDPLKEIADVAKRYSLWFHVDAAYGGSAVFSDDLRPLFAGIELADSITFDPHKWMYTPHSGGCLVVRDLNRLGGSFSFHANYHYQDLELTGRGLDFAMLGPQFSRGFQAFKVWVSLLAHGRKAYSRRIAHDTRLAQYMGQRVQQRSELELAAPVALSICCFRHVPPDLPAAEGREEYLNRLNERLLAEVQMDGRVFCSNAIRHGKFTLRMCIVNFRTEAKHIDQLLDVTVELGNRLDAEMRPAALRNG
jgi:aromatic-L-amino-acid/L-tryptophan decarboxylase